MFPNLLEDTKEYWCKLNQLEAAYQKGEVSGASSFGRNTQIVSKPLR